AGEWLGLGFVNLLHLFSPEKLIVGGSVATLGDLILEPARRIITRELLDEGFYHDDLLVPAHFGDDVCLVGAALYAQQMVQREPQR
ncbi:MAG: ROK family protein, partial [Chloroflexi bacterium]|nr:ROK family protein [Chloroflexota bacterium]